MPSYVCVALMLRKRMADSDTLPMSIHSKGLLMSRNNEMFNYTSWRYSQLRRGEGRDGGVEGSREELVCSAVGYLCNPRSFTVRELD